MFPVRPLGFGYQVWQSLLPRFLGRRVLHNVFPVACPYWQDDSRLYQGRAQAQAATGFKRDDRHGLFQCPRFWQGETSSATPPVPRAASRGSAL